MTAGLRATLPAIALAILVAAALAYSTSTPRVVSASDAGGRFSAELAMGHVREIALRPHPSGGADHHRVRDYIAAELARLGLTVEVQEATGIGTRYAAAARVWNVVARRAGRRGGGAAVLLMAHYDGVPASPGAGDDGAGSAVLLETMRALQRDTLEHDVIALFTDAEEAGLLGAAAFVREHPWAKDAAVTLNFEGRGTHGPSLMFETGPGNLDVVRVLRSVGGARATSLSTTVYRALPNDTDLSELAALGRPAMNFAFIGGVQRYHSAEDDVGQLDPRSVQHHGNQAIGLARALANGPLPRERTGDAVFFDLPLLGVVVYPQALALWLSLAALLLAVLALWKARRSDRAVLAAGLGFVSVVVGALLAAIAGAAIGAALQRLHIAIGSGAPEWSGLYAFSVVFLAIAVAAALHALLRRRLGAVGVRIGGVLVWSLCAVIASLLAPGVSFLFTWPALAFASAALIGASRPGSRAEAAAGWLGATLTAFLLVPTVYLMVCVALGLFPLGAALLALLVALGIGLLAPQMDALTRTRRWSFVIASVVASVVVFCIGLLTVRTDARSPAGVSLVYAVDSDSGQAWLGGIAFSPSARGWLAAALQTAGDSAPAVPPWLQRFIDAQSAVSVPLPIPAITPATATVIQDSAVGDNRRVTLRITPARGTRLIGIRAERGGVTSAWVDGRSVDTTKYRNRRRQWQLTYAAPPDTGFILALLFPAAHAPLLGLSSRHPGITTATGFRLPQRPTGVIAMQDGDVSLVYQRVEVARAGPIP